MIQRLKRMFGVPGPEQEQLHSVRSFRAILDRERDRSDRTHAPVALVSLNFKHSGEGEHLIPHTVAFLRKRLRSTDDFGLLADDRLGVVLPATDSQGAWTVALDVCAAIGCVPRQLNCEVFEYPESTDLDQGLPGLDGEADATQELPCPARPMLEWFCKPTPLSKRVVDIGGASLGLMACAPLFCLIAIAIKVSSPGPILFRQARSGIGGKRFTLYKFRTMVTGAEQMQAALRSNNEQDGPAFKMQNDPRITRIGRLLRKTSIDELPQLWNVLRGDMSLVGPRPLPCAEADACLRWQRRRLETTPGLTCIWQVSGRSRVRFDEWMRMDVRYVRSQSLRQDAALLAKTVPAVVLRRGAH